MMELNTEKPWWKSRGIWGGVVTVIAAIAGGFGIMITPEQQEAILAGVVAIVSGVAGVVSVVGRARATQKIKGKKK